MEYNSDYEVRLATLGALGGDTTKKYDSVYSIDLEILKLTEQGGGGGGMTYDQIKSLLASSGITEIVFNNSGDTSSVTLDYAKVMQIGQGGGDYICVDSVDALSGITNPQDGTMAYVENKGLFQYYAATAISDWLAYEIIMENLTEGALDSELNKVINDWDKYKIPFTAVVKVADGWGTIYCRLQPSDTYNGNWVGFSGYLHTTPDAKLRFIYGSIHTDDFVGDPQTRIWRWNSGFKYEDLTTVRDVAGAVAKKIYGTLDGAEDYGYKLGDEVGQFYNSSASGSSTGSIFTCTVTVDSSATTTTHIANVGGVWCGIIDVGELVILGGNGHLEMTPNDDWVVFKHKYNHGNQTWNIAAVRCIDNLDGTFTVDLFSNWGVNIDSESGYVFTEIPNQTITYKPSIYTITRKGDGSTSNYLQHIESSVEMFDGGTKKIRIMSQADYDALVVKDNNTIYYTTSY